MLVQWCGHRTNRPLAWIDEIDNQLGRHAICRMHPSLAGPCTFEKARLAGANGKRTRARPGVTRTGKRGEARLPMRAKCSPSVVKDRHRTRLYGGWPPKRASLQVRRLLQGQNKKPGCPFGIIRACEPDLFGPYAVTCPPAYRGFLPRMMLRCFMMELPERVM